MNDSPQFKKCCLSSTHPYTWFVTDGNWKNRASQRVYAEVRKKDCEGFGIYEISDLDKITMVGGSETNNCTHIVKIVGRTAHMANGLMFNIPIALKLHNK